MQNHQIVSREEWLVARKEFLAKEGKLAHLRPPHQEEECESTEQS